MRNKKRCVVHLAGAMALVFRSEGRAIKRAKDLETGKLLAAASIGVLVVRVIWVVLKRSQRPTSVS